MKKNLLKSALLAGLVLANFSHLAQAQTPQLDLPRTVLKVGMYQIQAQIAQTPQEREIGLMYREKMPQNEGMLFVFDAPAKQCFWMKNTQLPLTAAFIADDGSIVNFADMQPQTTQPHCSAKPVRFVLEMNQGWFRKKGITLKHQLKGAPFTP